MKPKKLFALAGAVVVAVTLSGCEGTTVSGGVSTGVYYDSMMWNDYYRPYPPVTTPPRPPVKPVPPIARPPRPVHPIAPRPPMHRPSPGGRRG